ncbi:hypothetical protein L1987_13296 [Smallanthus sonchifolius]|uniref:Uncharacterized protein n=1 Tax=Smallanthus sonchifolius TaxID=185202 RepID=A0ACB9JG51_9ASTR|nr:hypothetical protein L1987_13296 [Smallanthus sonchifolius]
MATGDQSRNDAVDITMHRVAYLGGWAARAPDPICIGRPPLHQLLLNDSESSLPRSDGAQAVSEYGEGYLCLGIQTDPRSELADLHVVLNVTKNSKLSSTYCSLETSRSPGATSSVDAAAAAATREPPTGL